MQPLPLRVLLKLKEGGCTDAIDKKADAIDKKAQESGIKVKDEFEKSTEDPDACAASPSFGCSSDDDTNPAGKHLRPPTEASMLQSAASFGSGDVDETSTLDEFESVLPRGESPAAGGAL